MQNYTAYTALIAPTGIKIQCALHCAHSSGKCTCFIIVTVLVCSFVWWICPPCSVAPKISRAVGKSGRTHPVQLTASNPRLPVRICVSTSPVHHRLQSFHHEHHIGGNIAFATCQLLLIVKWRIRDIASVFIRCVVVSKGVWAWTAEPRPNCPLLLIHSASYNHLYNHIHGYWTSANIPVVSTDRQYTGELSLGTSGADLHERSERPKYCAIHALQQIDTGSISQRPK